MLKKYKKAFSTALEYKKNVMDALKETDASFKLNARSKKRYSLCKACPVFNKALRQCKACGCLMFLKVRVLYFRCPLGKW